MVPTLPETIPADARLHLEPAPGLWRLWFGPVAHSLPRAAIVAWAARQADPVAARVARLVARIERPRGVPGAPAPILMGIVNVTPDSFSDGGAHDDSARAIDHGLRLAAEGARILDVGGESTRPGATPVDPREERRRVEPVVRALSQAGHRVSIDTRNAAVMQAAIDAGATMVNDVSALGHDPDSLSIVRDTGVDAVLMHMQGEPATMQQAPRYDRPAFDVYDWLEARIDACVDQGIPRDRLLADPGLGFGKHGRENTDILRRFALYRALGVPLVLGASRKGLIGAINKGWPAEERVPASIAAALHALDRGAAILRVHDVAATRQAVLLWQALRDAPEGQEAA